VELIITLIKGQWFMIPLAACSILMLAVILERRRSLEEATIDIDAFVDRIGEHVRRGGVEEALRECEATPGPVAAILAAGLRRYRLLREAGRSNPTSSPRSRSTSASWRRSATWLPSSASRARSPA